MEEGVVTLPLRRNTPLKYTSRRSESLEWPLVSLKIFDADGKETDRVIYLYAGRTYLGRSVAECNVVLEGLASISNRHVQFEVDSLGDGLVSCYITDCKSLNKTYVHSGTDVRALSPYVPSPLRDGDIVRLGHLKMAYSVIRGLNRLRLPRKTALGRQKLALPEEQFAPKTPQPSPSKRTERPSRVSIVNRERKNEDEPVIEEHPSHIPTIILDREPATQRLPVPENSPSTSEPQPGPSRALPPQQLPILDDEDDDFFPMSQAVDMRAPTPPRHMLLNGPRQSTIAETPDTPAKAQRVKIVVPLYDGDGNEMPPTTFSQLGGISYSQLSQEAREAANGGAGGEGDDVISGRPSEFFTPANDLDADDDIYIAETQKPSSPVVLVVESSDDDEPDDILTPMPIRRVEKKGNGQPSEENKENIEAEDSDKSYPLQIPESSDSETSVRRGRVGDDHNRFVDSQMETQAAPLASHADPESQFDTQPAPLIHVESDFESDDDDLEDLQMAVQTQYAPIVRASLAKLKLNEEDSQEMESSNENGDQAATVDEDKFEDSQEQFETQAAPLRPMEDSQMQTQAAPVRRDEDEDSEDDVQTQAVRLDDEEDSQVEERSGPEEKKSSEDSSEDSQLETQAAPLRPMEDPEENTLTQVAPGFDEDSQEDALTQAAPFRGVEELEMAEMRRGSEDSASLREESEREGVLTQPNIEMAETQVAPVRKDHLEDSQMQTQAAPLRPSFDEDDDDDLTQAEEANARLEDSQLQTQAAPLCPTFDEDDDEDLTQAAPLDDLEMAETQVAPLRRPRNSYLEDSQLQTQAAPLRPSHDEDEDDEEMAETQVAPLRRPRNSYLEDSQLQTQAAPLRPTFDEDEDDEEMAETQAAPVRRDHPAGKADFEDSQLQTQAAPLQPTVDEDEDDFFTPALRLDDDEEMAETQFAPLYRNQEKIQPLSSTEDSQLETQAAPVREEDSQLAETQPAQNLDDSQEFMATQAAPIRFSLDDSSEDVLTQAERILKDPHFSAMEELPETQIAQFSSEDEETQAAPLVAFDNSPAPLRSSISSVGSGNRLRKSVRFDNSAEETEETLPTENRRSFEESRKREEVGVAAKNPTEDSDEETVDPVVVAEGPLMAGNAEPEELSPVMDYGCADDVVSESSNDLDYGIDFSEDVARLAAQSVALGSNAVQGNEDPFDVDTQPAEPLIPSSPPPALVRKSSSTNSQLSQCSQVGLGSPFKVPQAFAWGFSQSDVCTPQELPHHDEEDEDASRNAIQGKSPIKRNLFGTALVKQEDVGDVREYHRVSPQPVTIDIDDDDIDLEAAANIDSQTLSRFMAGSPNRSLAQQEESRLEPEQAQEEQPPTVVVDPSKQGIPSVHELKECSVVLTRCDSAAFMHPPTGHGEGSGIESQRKRPAAAGPKKEAEPVPGPSTSVNVPSRRGRKPAQIESNKVKDVGTEQKNKKDSTSVPPRRGIRGRKEAETSQQPPKQPGRPKKAAEKKEDQPVPDQQEENPSAQVPLPVAKNVRQNRQKLKEIAEIAPVNLGVLKRERIFQDAENQLQEEPGTSTVAVGGRKGDKNPAAPVVDQGSSSSAATTAPQRAPVRGRPIKRERLNMTEQEPTPAPEVPTRRRPQRRAAAAANIKMEEWTHPKKHSRPSSPAHSEASTASSRSRSATDKRRQAASPVPSEGRASSVGSRGVSPAEGRSQPKAQKRAAGGKKEEAQEKPVPRKRARGNAQQQKAQQEQGAEQQEQTAGKHQQEEAPTRKRGRPNAHQEQQHVNEQMTLKKKEQEELLQNKGPGGKQGRRIVNKKAAQQEQHPSEPQEGTSSEQGEEPSGRHGRKNVNKKQEEEQKEVMPIRRGQRNINRRAAQQQQEEEQQQELMPPPARPGKAQVKKEAASRQEADEPVASTSSSSPVKRTAASREKAKAAPVSKKARMKQQETVEETVNAQANPPSMPRYSRVLTSVAPKFQPKCKSVVDSLGGRIVGQEELESGEFDVLIVDNFRPTVEILSAVSLGLPVVGREWITECALQKAFVEPWQYIVRCAANERHYRAQLEESIVLAQSRREAHDRLLFSFKFFIDPEVENPPADKYHIFLSHAGASSVTELSARPRIPRDGTAVIVVPTGDEGSKANDPRFKDAKIVSADDVLGAILRQHAPFLES